MTHPALAKDVCMGILKKKKEVNKMENINLPVVGKLVKCNKCNRAILVEYGLIGTNHTIGEMAICWDCLPEDAKVKARKIYGIKEV